MIGFIHLCILGYSVDVCIATGCPFHHLKWSLPSCKEIVVGISVLMPVVCWVLLLFPWGDKCNFEWWFKFCVKLRIFLAGMEWLWPKSCDNLDVQMGFSGSSICSSISSSGNSDWLLGWFSMRSIKNLFNWVGTSGRGDVFYCSVCTLWNCACCVSTLWADVASLALLACCLNMLRSCVMASFLMLETGIAPVIASDRMSAAFD